MLPNWTPGAPKRQAASKRPSDDVSNGLDSKRGRFEGVVTPIRERNKRTPLCPNPAASTDAPRLERQAGLFGEAAEKAIELIPIGLVSECSAMSTPHRPNRKASTDAPKKPKGRPLLHRSDGVDESLLVKKEK